MSTRRSGRREETDRVDERAREVGEKRGTEGTHVSIGEETIGVRMVMFFVSFVCRSTSVAAKLMWRGGR